MQERGRPDGSHRDALCEKEKRPPKMRGGRYKRKRKRAGRWDASDRPCESVEAWDLGLVHPAHAAARHTATAACTRARLRVFLDVRHQSFGGEHQAGDRSGILQSEARDLGRVDYARLDQVAELLGFRVVAEV